jgi:hypothetical protein
MRDRIERLLFRKLCERPSEQSLQYYELQVAFQNATRNSLSDYAEAVVAIVENLEQLEYIRCATPGKRMPLFFSWY